mmetsp:Transcript_50971/g.168782  ORF Transcript_50971/g.168782 Transcript_50971/m.168782 type:complete len:456 (+) Transcript_50971:1288-2655(+)
MSLKKNRIHPVVVESSDSLRDLLAATLADQVRAVHCEEVIHTLGVHAVGDWAGIQSSPSLLERAVQAMEKVINLAEIGLVLQALRPTRWTGEVAPSVPASPTAIGRAVVEQPAHEGHGSPRWTREVEQTALQWPLVRVWLHYSFMSRRALLGLDVAVPTLYNMSVFTAVASAKVGSELRDVMLSGCEVLIIYNTLLLTVAIGGWLFIGSAPLETPVDVLCLTVWVAVSFLFWFAVIYDLLLLQAFSYVSDANLHAVIKSALPVYWIGRKMNVLASYSTVLALLLTALRSCAWVVDAQSNHHQTNATDSDDDSTLLSVWLVRPEPMPWSFRMLPMWIVVAFALSIPFVLLAPLNAIARLIMHSGVIADAPVLPCSSRHWSPEKTRQALAAKALANREPGASPGPHDSKGRSSPTMPNMPVARRMRSRSCKFLVGRTRSLKATLSGTRPQERTCTCD